MRVCVVLILAMFGMIGCGSSSSGAAGYGYCPGYVQPFVYAPGSGALCRSSSACEAGTFCLAPGVELCPACNMAFEACGVDAECPTGQVCQELGRCGMCPFPFTECRAPCDASSCASDQFCNSTGHCMPTACSGSADCGINLRCDPVSPVGDEHGCAPLGCAADADCDCGTCVDGTCRAGPGRCSGPAA